MKLIPFLLQYLRYFKLYSLLLQIPIIIHHSSQIMSSTTGFTEFVQPSTPPKSPTPASSVVSPPENTPAEATTPPQLAIRSQPFPNDNDDALSVALSSIDFNRVADKANDGDDAPVGFVINDPESRHYYPVYVPNPQYGQWDEEEPMVVAKYIWYSPEYLFVTGCNGKAYPEKTIPVYIGRMSNHYHRMNPTMWKELRRNSPQEFMVNEAAVDLGDPQVIAELNRYRGKADIQDTLRDILKDARKRVVDAEKEYLVVQRDLVDSMNRIERAGLYDTLQMQMRHMFNPPVIPDRHYSPEPVPLAPHMRGPVEMPVLMEGNLHRVRCFRCKKQGHKAQDCMQKKHRACTICNDHGHRKAACPFRKRGKVDVFVEQEVKKEVEDLGKMTLLERIALLNRPDWTPPACVKCSRSNPGHTELECPEYEYCGWCQTSGSYGFIARHKCTAGYEEEHREDGWGAADEYADQNRWD